MKNNILQIYIPVIFALLFTACSGGNESLNFSLKKGKTYSIQISKEIKNYVEINNETSNINENMTTGFAFTPIEITKDGIYRIEAKIVTLAVDIVTSKGTIKYDSQTDKKAPLIALPFANMINKPFSISMKNDGSIISVEGMKKIINDAFEGFVLNDVEIRKFVALSLEEQYNDATLFETFERMFSFYPGKQVSPGEKWTKMVAFSNKQPLIMKSEFELIEQNNGVAVISVNSELSTDREKVARNGNQYGSSVLVGKQNGKLMIDQISGWVTKAYFNYSMYEANSNNELAASNGNPRLLSSEVSINYAPLINSAFREIEWSPNAIVKGDGIGMTLIGMGVVYSSLVLLYVVFLNLSNLFERKKKPAAEPNNVPIANTLGKTDTEVTGELNAAIAIALHLYDSEIHDDENAILTIQRSPRFYSPWSSKIYGIRKNPR